jgi:hypothetical protein
LPMQCFIPFSEEVLEQHPELLAGGLVPFREEFLNYTVEFEVLSPNQAKHLAAANSELNEKVFPKVHAI